MNKNIDLMSGQDLVRQDYVNVSANRPWQVVTAGAFALAATFMVANGEGLVTTRAEAVVAVEESRPQLPDIPKPRKNSDMLYRTRGYRR